MQSAVSRRSIEIAPPHSQGRLGTQSTATAAKADPAAITAAQANRLLDTVQRQQHQIKRLRDRMSERGR